MYLDSLYFFCMFGTAFKKHDTEESRYTEDAEKHDDTLKQTVDNLMQDLWTFKIKFAGKNSITNEGYRARLCEVVDTLLQMLFFTIVVAFNFRVFILSEGDNYEPDKAPFSRAQLAFIKMCHENGVEVNFLLIKNTPSAFGLSSAFVDVWKKELNAIDTSLIKTKVYFGMVGTGHEQITFDAATMVYFIGTEMCEEHMYKRDASGNNKVPTTGYAHLMKMDIHENFARVPAPANNTGTLVTFYNTKVMANKKKFKDVTKPAEAAAEDAIDDAPKAVETAQTIHDETTGVAAEA